MIAKKVKNQEDSNQAPGIADTTLTPFNSLRANKSSAHEHDRRKSELVSESLSRIKFF